MTIKYKHRIILLAVFVLCAQWYLGILSTRHALHNMPLNCPICALTSHYDDVAVNQVQQTLAVPAVEHTPVFFSPYQITSLAKAYLSRAPPRQ